MTFSPISTFRRSARLLSLVVFTALTGTAAAEECWFPEIPVAIRVKADEGTVRMVTTAGIAEVTEKAGLPTSSGARGAQHALGLTHSAFEQRFVVDVTSVETTDGWRCGRVREIRAQVGFTAMDVYIAREFPAGSCQYDAVLRHEQVHVGINREVLARHAREFEEALQRIAAGMEPVRARTTDDAARIAADRIEEGLEPLFGGLEAALREANARFDTAAEYWRLRRECKSW